MIMINDGARTDLGLEKVACLWAVGGGEMIGDTLFECWPGDQPRSLHGEGRFPF